MRCAHRLLLRRVHGRPHRRRLPALPLGPCHGSRTRARRADGFKIEGHSFDLKALKEKRDNYVKRLNGIYANNLGNSGVTSITGDASFVGPKEVRVGDKTYSGDNVLIAVGGTPTMPDIPGIELAVNSNGFFDFETMPKRVAVVGSGYIAVELAGIMQILGAEVDLVIRGERPLRTMEPDIVDLMVEEMSHSGINWVRGEIASISAAADGTKSCALKSGESIDGYDEVLFAIGREPVTGTLNLEAAGVEATPRGEVVVDAASRTSAEGVYAVGDVITGAIQLTPVAIAAGRLLSDRLFNGVPLEQSARTPCPPVAPPAPVRHARAPHSPAPRLTRGAARAAIMDYSMVPTVVFSHPPLAVMGLTEAEAVAKHGADAVTVHKSTWVNMMYVREFLNPTLDEGGYMPKTRAKLICVGPEQTVVGVHMVHAAALPTPPPPALRAVRAAPRTHSPAHRRRRRSASPSMRSSRVLAWPSRWVRPRPTSIRSSPSTRRRPRSSSRSHRGRPSTRSRPPPRPLHEPRARALGGRSRGGTRGGGCASIG